MEEKVEDIVMRGVIDVSTGEGWRTNRSNGRSYILGPAANQDPSGNIDKESGMIWPINNTTAHHHTFLIIQSDLDDHRDNGLPLTLISQHDLFIVSFLLCTDLYDTCL